MISGQEVSFRIRLCVKLFAYLINNVTLTVASLILN